MEKKQAWFNNVTVEASYEKNGWKVMSFVTKNGHKVRGITKSDKTNAVVGTKVNVLVQNVEKATYVNAVIPAREA